MSNTTFLFSTLSILSLLSVTISNPVHSETPLLNIGPTTFLGKGSLVALRNGAEIGCLSNNMKILGINNGCGIFYSSVEAGIPEYVPVTIMSSTREACGFGYVPVFSPSFTPKYKIGCPPPTNTQDDTIYSVPGKGLHAGYRIMVVGLQRDYTTDDGEIPVGADEKDVLTNEVALNPRRFQIAWKSS